MGPDSLSYQESIALEFSASKNRIRYLIGATHWGEDGRHKEVILMNFLKRFLPNNVAVGTGFIKESDNVSTQIDIIIYDPSLPIYFKENDFIIVQPKSVLGIIEVKSNPDTSKIGDAILKANRLGALVQRDYVFNGLFIFGETNGSENYSSKMLKKPRNGKIKNSLLDSLSVESGTNHIVSMDGVFIKKWTEDEKFSCYGINNLAVSYFFSNLLDVINTSMGLFGITESMYKHLYPICEGKGSFKKWDLVKPNTDVE